MTVPIFTVHSAQISSLCLSQDVPAQAGVSRGDYSCLCVAPHPLTERADTRIPTDARRFRDGGPEQREQGMDGTPAPFLLTRSDCVTVQIQRRVTETLAGI